jgi:predicted transcriptional regulator
MARPFSKYPTELELEILKVLWRGGPSSVGGVRDALVGFRDLAYTSVMTIMNIMVNKGYLKRAREGNRFVYRPQVSEKETTRRMLSDLTERAFDGSASAVMLNLLETADVDDDELRQLRQLVDRRLKEKKS